MIDLTKKWSRKKVTAEITLEHVQQFARELGSTLTPDEVTTFLNQNGHGQEIWMRMMQAGEEYIKTNLKQDRSSIHQARKPSLRAGAPPPPLQHRAMGTQSTASASYQ